MLIKASLCHTNYQLMFIIIFAQDLILKHNILKSVNFDFTMHWDAATNFIFDLLGISCYLSSG
jgi:hypothetical protein